LQVLHRGEIRQSVLERSGHRGVGQIHLEPLETPEDAEHADEL
jgi:hypothetical protein